MRNTARNFLSRSITRLIPNIKQDIRFVNNTTDSLSTIVLNDWNNAYANVNTPLAKRFSDEFYRGFHLSNLEERGSTYGITILNDTNLLVDWSRTPEHPDVITIALQQN
jgi:hypothetical protein